MGSFATTHATRGLPHRLVPQFSPVKTAKGGMRKKLCLQIKTYFVHPDQD